MDIQLTDLLLPFPPDEIEWRLAQKGAKEEGGIKKPWAKVLAYVTNRAIMNRLDDVCGPENWQNDFRHLDGAFLCGIGIKVHGEWVWKWDGAQESQIEATKGGISGAMKRAAVQWGIGRYLYLLEEGWADISPNGKHWVAEDKSKGVPAFKWNPPKLPPFALPCVHDSTVKSIRTATDMGALLKLWKLIPEAKHEGYRAEFTAAKERLEKVAA